MTTSICKALLFVLLNVLSFQGLAAEIVKVRGEQRDTDVITVKGKFIPGDDEKFRNIALTTKRATVLLDSPGGSLTPALEIGKIIRMKGFSTSVKDAECASACAMVWLAGEPRVMNNAAMIGFHAASFKDDGGKRTATASGNARIGAYLATMGFNERVVQFVTGAGPADIQWLKKGTADRLGVMVSLTTEDERRKAIQAFHTAIKKLSGADASDDAAARLYAQAADSGYAGAQNNLGDFYETGKGVPKNERLALYWYVRAAERGEPTAYLSLAALLQLQTTDKNALSEALKFAILAYTTLPEGANKMLAQNLTVTISAQLSDAEKTRALELANRWTPLYQEEHLMGDKPKEKLDGGR